MAQEPVRSAAILLARIRERFATPEYATFAEVGDRTGGRNRSVDALALSLWPSRGLELYGFEIKVARSDWVAELKRPAKAETIARFCDRWWIVVGDAGIVHAGELPPTWGLMSPKGEGLVVNVEAPKFKAEPLTRPFVAAICRAAQKEAPADAIIKMAKAAGYAEGLAKAESIAQSMVGENAGLRHSVDAFEKMSGVKIDGWNGALIGKTVRRVLDLHRADPRIALEHTADQFTRMAKECRDLLKAIPLDGQEE